MATHILYLDIYSSSFLCSVSPPFVVCFFRKYLEGSGVNGKFKVSWDIMIARVTLRDNILTFFSFQIISCLLFADFYLIVRSMFSSSFCFFFLILRDRCISAFLLKFVTYAHLDTLIYVHTY